MCRVDMQSFILLSQGAYYFCYPNTIPKGPHSSEKNPLSTNRENGLDKDSQTNPNEMNSGTGMNYVYTSNFFTAHTNE